MELCPKCGANVEGLVHHCDICGASLCTESPPPFVVSFCYEFISCSYFHVLINSMVHEIQPTDTSQYEGFLKQIEIISYCFPESLLEEGKIKNRVMYSNTKKVGRITIVVDYKEFVLADVSGKARLVAEALCRGISLLQDRMHKYKFDISDIKTHIHNTLTKYF